MSGGSCVCVCMRLSRKWEDNEAVPPFCGKKGVCLVCLVLCVHVFTVSACGRWLARCALMVLIEL